MKLHQAVYKQAHQRRVIRDVVGHPYEGGVINDNGEVVKVLDTFGSKTAFSEIESPVTPSDYFHNFKKNLKQISLNDQNTKIKNSIIIEAKESEYTDEVSQKQELEFEGMFTSIYFV
jgi:hypothetical protein